MHKILYVVNIIIPFYDFKKQTIRNVTILNFKKQVVYIRPLKCKRKKLSEFALWHLCFTERSQKTGPTNFKL